MRITQQDYEPLRDFFEDLMSRYREEFSIPVTTNWRDYEYFYMQRMKGIALELRAMINESSSFLVEEFGRPSLLNAKGKVFVILVNEIFRLSNRKAAYPLPLLGISKDISYKTVERLYSVPLLPMILNNLLMNSLKRKGIASVDASRQSNRLFPHSHKALPLHKGKGW